MYCCSDYQYFNEPLLNCYEKCIFCLGKFNKQQGFLIYNMNVFKLVNKSYLINCICRPFCHISCMNTWLIENERCPECSVYFTELTKNKKYTFGNLCAYTLIFLCVSTIFLIIIGIVAHNKHIL